MTKCVVIGAGVSGLMLGRQMAAQGIPTTVFEASDVLGGLAGTFREDGYSLDFGPHSFFSEDDEVREFVLNLFENNLKAHSRQVKFNYRGRLLDYPLTAYSVLCQMGWDSTLKALWDFLITKVTPRKRLSKEEDLSVEEWALASFGPHLYKTFFKPYTEQFWKISCRELSARSIPTHTRLNFENTLKFLFRKKKDRTPVRGSQIERESLPTFYPPTGYGEIAEKLASQLKSLGGEIRLSSKVIEIRPGDLGGFKILLEGFGNPEEIYSDIVVSTLPLPVLISRTRISWEEKVRASAQELQFRPLVMLGMATSKQNILSADYIYTLDRPYNRMVEMNKFDPATSPAQKNILSVEIPALRTSLAWNQTQEALFEECIPFLESDGILKRNEVEKLFLVKTAYAYPIYRKNYGIHLKRVLEALDQIPNLYTLGRGGEFRYMDVDQCLRRAWDLSKKILKSLEKPVGEEVVSRTVPRFLL